MYQIEKELYPESWGETNNKRVANLSSVKAYRKAKFPWKSEDSFLSLFQSKVF
jgi:hypothetical protein